MTHTPGPWFKIIDGPNTKPRMCLIATRANDAIAIDVTNSGANWNESIANARLIAAAPDLYEACKATLIDLRVWRLLTERGCEDAIARLEAAVAKAEGRDIKEEG